MTLRRSRLAAFAASLLVLASCSAGDPAPPAAADPDAPSTPAVAADAAGTDEAEVLARFDSTLAALRSAYSFNTRVELAGEVVTEVSGRHVDGDSSFVASSADTVVEVINVAGAVWTRTDQGDWSQTAPADLGGDPLGPLMKTTRREAVGEQINVGYPGAVFGLDVETVAVAARVDGDAVELVYVDGDVVVRSRLAPPSDSTAIIAPA
ncbi:MAG: hypothetical protein ACE5GB_12840, partial [Acidimicrobiales bacterium]